MTSNELRQKFLEFFKARAHAVLPSAPLVPENDPTTLFTSSGMQPIVPFLLGQKHPEGTRLVDSQKCFRTVDIDEIGDNRHLTFFEMLGNWSLGDFFKKEQIPWMFEFCTKEIGLDPSRFYITVFRGDESIGVAKDDESVELWKKMYASVGIDAVARDFPERDGMGDGRIFYYPAEKNWWSRAGVPQNMPVGEPGGPDSEMFWDFSAQGGSASGGGDTDFHARSKWKDLPCHVNCDCGRFVEFGNNVFMEFVRTQSGFEKLKQQNVDYGGGLERIMMAIADNSDIFMTDCFVGLRTVLERRSTIRYGIDPEKTKAFRVVMDHMRAATFLIGDGVLPSNKDQGYFVRRLVRRAVRFAQQLGITQDVCRELAEQVIAANASAYPRLGQESVNILAALEKEEQKFRKTLALGLKEFERMMAQDAGNAQLSAHQAFDLYQSYGFPLEMTQELVAERGATIDVDGFRIELEKHQEQSRAGSTQKFAGGLADRSVETTRLHTANHLMLEALKRVLGRELNQKGSNITAERLRFDFNYPEKLTLEQIAKVEALVNEQVEKDVPVHFELMPLDKAKEIGATGVFDERYSENVKVYKMGQSGNYFSVEICGGPHVRHTGQVGKIKILKEEAVSAGIRRVKAVVSEGLELQPGEEATEGLPV